jgi:N-methylhydantoinase A
MLGIVTIGAGGGSIGWIDEGGLLRMGPQSAGADPGPVCYGRGGERPTCTDADLLLGYLDADAFAGGKIKLDREAAVRAIAESIGAPLGLSELEAAAGMYRVINTNMAQGVREVSIERGYDPREFPLIVAGGAGPIHACMICEELEIPMFIVPRESSIFCAAGMLMSDLQHDFVRSFVAPFDQIEKHELLATIDAMITEGEIRLGEDRIPESRRNLLLSLDCRYVKQYHEVGFAVPVESIRQGDMAGIATRFHAEHNRMYGYSLEEEGTAIELINVRLRAVGLTEKPASVSEPYAGSDPAAALKGERPVYLPAELAMRELPVYDGGLTRHGHRIAGPAIIEQDNTTLFLSSAFDCVCDRSGSYAVFRKGKESLVQGALAGEAGDSRSSTEQSAKEPQSK